MNQREVEDLIIELLALEAGCDLGEFRTELEAGGQDLPVDSLLAAEVMARVEERCGVSLPATPETSKHLKSVTAFARAICELIHERDGRSEASA